MLKILGIGFKQYTRDRFNWFDGGIVIISAADIVVTYTFS